VRRCREAGLPEPPFFVDNLSTHHGCCALQFAAGITNRYWRAAQKNAGTALRKAHFWEGLSDSEKHFVNRLLSELSADFFALLNGRNPRPAEDIVKEGGVQRLRKLCGLVRRFVHREQGTFPLTVQTQTAWFDENCYRVKMKTDEAGETYQELSLTTLERGKRVAVRVYGKSKIRGTIILVKNGTGWCVHVLHKTKKREAPFDAALHREGKVRCMAFDMGKTEVFMDCDGRAYGKNFGKVIDECACELDAKHRERNRLMAAVRNNKDPAKSRRILKFNLGSQTVGKLRSRCHARVEQCVNEAINDMIAAGKSEVFIIEAFGRHSFDLSKFSKKTRNLLTRWVRGIVTERLAFDDGLLYRPTEPRDGEFLTFVCIH